MLANARNCLVLVLISWGVGVRADELAWRPASTQTAQSVPTSIIRLSSGELTPTVTLLRPQPISRGQAPDNPPPPPPYPGAGVTPIPTASANDPAYACGVVTNNSDQGGFWNRCGSNIKKCWEGVCGGATGLYQTASTRTLFESDHEFDNFISPVTNPFFFEDPRSLSELRPIFIWQRTPSSNAIFAGGNNYAADVQARLAITPNLSVVINEMGYTWTGISNTKSGFESHAGFEEIRIGPKFTFFRNETSKTVMAAGATFAIPVGPAKVFQDTGTLSVIPYFSIAQSFLRSSYGTFNFMNTDGYSFAIDNQRTDFFYASFHLDYDVGNLQKIYPLVEANWTHYTMNGGVRPFNFEGNDLFNFGSTNVKNSDTLTVAVGARYLFTQNIQLGIAGQMSVLNNSGGRNLDLFRLTVDMIFRY